MKSDQIYGIGKLAVVGIILLGVGSIDWRIPSILVPVIIADFLVYAKTGRSILTK